MCRDNAPSFGQPDPDLALPAADCARCRRSLKLQCNAGEVEAETHNVQPRDCARQIGRRPAFAKGCKFLRSVEILSDAESHHLRTRPEHCHQCVDIVRNERLFIPQIERSQFSYNLWFVDDNQIGNSLLSGRICLLSAALTVCTGSFTTWLSRKRRATLQRMYA